MDKKKLITKLNWFYSLEINQVELYKTQSREVENQHVKRALTKFAEIEQGHVENVRGLIEKLGETPMFLGEIAAEITGKIAGKLSSLPTLEKLLKFNIAIEKKAISDYRNLMEQVDDLSVRDLLWNNMIDEELHTSWMTSWVGGFEPQGATEDQVAAKKEYTVVH